MAVKSYMESNIAIRLCREVISRQSVHMNENSGNDPADLSCIVWNAVEKENVVKKDIIHENSNNHNKYINNENSGEKPAEQAGAVLRAMTVDDISAVEQIEQICFSDAWSEKLLSDLLESEWDEAWVLTDTDGTRIGYANFRFLAGEGELMRIAVLPEHRGRGESKKLMDRLEISAKEKKAPDLTLEVRAGNTPAINLYKSYGFQAEAVRKNYYQNPVEDALIMWRRSVPSIPT